jgi:hypothetical protein
MARLTSRACCQPPLRTGRVSDANLTFARRTLSRLPWYQLPCPSQRLVASLAHKSRSAVPGYAQWLTGPWIHAGASIGRYFTVAGVWGRSGPPGMWSVPPGMVMGLKVTEQQRHRSRITACHIQCNCRRSTYL